MSDGVARVRHGVLDDPDAALVTDLRSYVELATGETEAEDDELLASLFAVLADAEPRPVS